MLDIANKETVGGLHGTSSVSTFGWIWGVFQTKLCIVVGFLAIQSRIRTVGTSVCRQQQKNGPTSKPGSANLVSDSTTKIIKRYQT